jgi:serine phosphatase RsbU (regulator of sigma subunit)
MPANEDLNPNGDPELLAAVIEHEPLGVAVIHLPDLVYEHVNPAFQAFAPGKPMVGKRNDQVFPEMQFLAEEVLGSLKIKGDTWRAENVRNEIRRTPEGPLEEVFGTFDVTRIEIHDRPYLLVTAVETTESVRIANQYQRLHEDEERRLKLSETMDSVNATIHSSLDYDEVIQRSLEAATKALGARAAAFFVETSPGESEATYVYGLPRSFLGRRFSASLFPFSQLMASQKSPIGIEADRIGTLMNPLLARTLRIRSLLAIPLLLRDTLVGGIGLVYSKPHEFTEAEMHFSRTFGASLSLALENAQLYRRQEEVANTLQEALLVLPEHVRDIDFAYEYNSASERAKVGGDFFDLFEVDESRVAITIGDISGKGLSAAVLTSLVKHSVRTKALESADSPSSVIRVVNKVLHEGSPPESFATVFFGVLDRVSGRLIYCNAGHTSGAIIRAVGELDELTPNSQLVGALPRGEFVDDTAQLERGDVLFLYTDGVTEARSGRELFGEERLWGVLRRPGTPAPGSLIDRTLSAVLRFSGNHLTDDIAMLALARCPAAD